MSSHVNAGLRHVLEVYPIAYVAMGVVAAWAFRRRRGAATVVAALAVCIVGEVVAARGDYIPFFNVIGRAAGPLELLGDANLDWGQDLKGLVAWQGEHPGVP